MEGLAEVTCVGDGTMSSSATCNGAMEGLTEVTLEQFLEAAPATARAKMRIPISV